MLLTPFEFQIVLTPKPIHHTESTTLVLSPKKFPQTAVSSGISVLVETYVSLRRNGGNLQLLRSRDRVRMVLKLFRFLDIIPNFENEALALASFLAPSYSTKP